MPRGFVWATYISDNPIRRFARQVDADQVLDPQRGWTTTGTSDLTPFPQQSRPRTVFGTSITSGRPGQTVVGSTTAPLWVGSSTTFNVEANDGTIDTITITGRRGERIRHFPAGP